MTAKEIFLPNQKRYHAATLDQDLSDEEIAKDWTLSEADKKEVGKYRKNSRVFIAIQLCVIRLYGRFLAEANDLSPRIINYLNTQLALPPSLTIPTPERYATFSEQRKSILSYLGFSNYGTEVQTKLEIWLEKQARQGSLPDELLLRTEQHLLLKHVVLPGQSVLERLVVSVCSEVHEQLFESLYNKLSPNLKSAIDDLLALQSGSQRSLFHLLKEYPPSATISSIQNYLERYRTLNETGVDAIEVQFMDLAFVDYLYRLTRRYSAKERSGRDPSKKYSNLFHVNSTPTKKHQMFSYLFMLNQSVTSIFLL